MEAREPKRTETEEKAMSDAPGPPKVTLCPLHDGSMEKLLAEALKAKHVNCGYCLGHIKCDIGKLLAAYEAKAGKSGE